MENLFQELQKFATDIDNQELEDTIASLRRNIYEPFLFVVVGEVKAGKSSFINALLQETICQTAAEPCTDIIQQIVYADTASTEEITPYLKKIALPIPILENLSIVDTPGTNTIIANHQEITKKFIPNSDLVFFVFFAKNPYTQSAWDLLEYVQVQWRKKVIFILQQADLTKPEELTKNTEKLQEIALLKGITNPIIFATSAELENGGEIEQGGFIEVRKYIQETLGGKETVRLKLHGVVNTSEQIIKQLTIDIEHLQKQLETDRQVVSNIQSQLQQNKQQSSYELDSLVVRLLSQYDTITARVKQEFRTQLSIVSLIKSSLIILFKGGRNTPSWMDELKNSCEAELKSSLGEISQDGIKHFVEGIRQLLQNAITELKNLPENRINSHHISLQVIERRQEVIEDVQEKVSSLLTDKSFLHSIESINASIAPNLLGGGAATIAGTLIAAITEIVLLDIIGAAFAGIGLVFAGSTLFWKKRQIINQFEENLDQERHRFEREIATKLTSKLDIIYEEIERNFLGIYNYVATEEAKILPLVASFQKIKTKAETVFNNLG